MKVINLSEQPSLLNQYLKEMRSVEIQKDSMRFRRNIERIGEIMAVEISKHLSYAIEPVQTPLAIAEVQVPQDQIVLGTILRAGLPLHQGFLNMYDHAENAFVASYVQHVKNAGGDIIATITKEYLGATEDKQVVVVYNGTNLASGLTLDGATIAIPDMNPANVVYDGGEGTDAAVVYIKDDGSEVSFTEQAGASTATIAPYVLTSNIKSHATVKIGSKIWLAEDFCTTKYVDGTDITSAVAGDAWTTTDARVFINGDKYLYNGFAIGYAASGDCDDSNFAPAGWKLIVADEWTALGAFVNNVVETLNGDALFGATSWLKAAASSGKVKFSALTYTNTWGGGASASSKAPMLLFKSGAAATTSSQGIVTGFSVRLVQE